MDGRGRGGVSDRSELSPPVPRMIPPWKRDTKKNGMAVSSANFIVPARFFHVPPVPVLHAKTNCDAPFWAA